MKLSGHRAVVTGSAQGIGFAIANRLTEEGCRVALLDLNEEGLGQACAKLPGSVAVRCDVSSPDDIGRALAQAADQLGGFDIVVNNAGILNNTPIEEVTEALWDRIMAVNLKSVFFMVQKALPYLKVSSCPRVINTSSMAGRMGGYETGMGYSASKGGINALTMGLARQLAKHKITVNAVCPGTTETPITREFSPEAMQNLYARIPVGRLGKPEEIAAAVAFLASEEAGFITGVLMDINGGMYMG